MPATAVDARRTGRGAPWALLACTLALLATAACGTTATGSSSSGGVSSSSTSTQSTCTPPDGWANNYTGIVMHTSFTFSNGLTTLACTFDNPEVYAGSPGSPLSCASLASTSEFDVPSFHSSSHGGGTVSFLVSINDSAYRGPATYTKESLRFDPFFFTNATDTFGLGHYVTASATTATVMINADGSGSFTFSGLVPEPSSLPQGNGQAWPNVSGKVTWTCKYVPTAIATP